MCRSFQYSSFGVCSVGAVCVPHRYFLISTFLFVYPKSPLTVFFVSDIIFGLETMFTTQPVSAHSLLFPEALISMSIFVVA